MTEWYLRMDTQGLMVLGDVLLSGACVRPRSSLTDPDNACVAIPVSESPLMYLFGCTPNNRPRTNV